MAKHDNASVQKDQEEQVAIEETVEETEQQDETRASQLADLDNKYKRVLADYQNLEKRVREERQDWIRSANRELLLRLLPILDTLVLANQHVQNDGLAITIKQFLDQLKAEGVEKIETVGKPFDPHLMEVVSVEDGQENIVIHEVRAGYIMHDKLLRPAQVAVGNGEEKE